jgi:hypothetical protein
MIHRRPTVVRERLPDHFSTRLQREPSGKAYVAVEMIGHLNQTRSNAYAFDRPDGAKFKF